MKNSDKKLHITAYDHFREYLDLTYSAGGGKELIGLSTGYPLAGLLPLPNIILDQLSPYENGKEKPRAGYGWEAGSRPVREAAIEYENLIHGTSYTIDNICLVAGATYGLNRILERLFEDMKSEKNELLIVAPTFYRMLARAERVAKVRSVSASKKNDYQVTVEELMNAISPKTKAVFLLNPSNPTYLYYLNEFFNELIPLLEEKGIYLIIDESGDAYYAKETHWINRTFTPKLASSKVIRIVTASKKYLLAEFRIGYVLGGKEFMGDKKSGFVKIVGDDIGNPPFAANDAWLEIIKQEIKLLKDEKDEKSDFFNVMTYNLNKLVEFRDYSISMLKDSGKVDRIIVPDANFNLTFSLKKGLYKTDLDFYKELLEKTKVSLLPASGLGTKPEDLEYRLTYAIHKPMLIEGMEKLNKFLKNK